MIGIDALGPRVRVVVTTREDGNLALHTGDDAAAVAARRAALVERAALPAMPRFLTQVHGTAIVTPEAHEIAPRADGWVVASPRQPVAILTADCLPIVLASRDGDALAVVHAGWRGLAAGIVEQALRRLPARVESMSAWIGPAIDAAHYEVDDLVRDAFPHHASSFRPTRPGHYHADLVRIAVEKLGAAGVTDIHEAGLSTYVDARFDSHRRDGGPGRFATIAWLEP